VEFREPNESANYALQGSTFLVYLNKLRVEKVSVIFLHIPYKDSGNLRGTHLGFLNALATDSAWTRKGRFLLYKFGLRIIGDFSSAPFFVKLEVTFMSISFSTFTHREYSNSEKFVPEPLLPHIVKS